MIVEVARRFLALALMCVGAVFLVWPGGPVLVVQRADFAAMHAEGFFSKDEPLGDFIARKTADRTATLDDPTWPALADRVLRNDPSLAQRRIHPQSGKFLFTPDEPPFAGHSLAAFQYVQHPDTGAWFSISRDYPQNVYGLDGRFLYPHRTAGFALLAVGLGLYFLLPRKRPEPGEMRHHAGAAVLGPDLLGLGLTPFFLGLPLAVVWHNAPEAALSPLNGGWIWLYVAFGLMAAVGVALLVAGLRYALLSYRLMPEGLLVRSWTGEKLLAWSVMSGWERYEKMTSRRLGLLLLLFGGSFSSIGLGLALRNTPERGVRIHHRGADAAHTLDIMENRLPGFDAIVHALREHRVPTLKPRRRS